MIGRAWVSVTPEFLVDLLGLPPSARIVRADMNDSGFNLRLGIEDPQLRPSEPGARVPEISLVLRQEDTTDGIRRVYASYSSAPGVSWLVFERLIPKPPSAETRSAA